MENMKRKNQPILLIITGTLIVLFVISTGWFLYKNTLTNTSQTEQAETPLGNGEVLLSFSPNILPAKNGGSVSANIVYDAGLNPTTSLLITVTYDPKTVTNVKLTPYKDPASALSYSFEENINRSTNAQDGTATLVLSLVPGATAQKGHGVVANLTATVLSSPTTISLSPDSSALNESVILSLGRVNLNITK